MALRFYLLSAEDIKVSLTVLSFQPLMINLFDIFLLSSYLVFRRVAEVWMDEYKEYIYNRRPHYRALDAGDISEQRAVRERLKCKSFKWFMTEVAFDLTKKYPIIDPVPAATGDIRSAVDTSLCIEALGASQVKPIRLSKCIRDGAGLNGMQKFELSFHDDIRPVKL